MIVDAFVKAMCDLVRTVLSVLPQGSLGLPSAYSVANSLAGLDSLVPVLLPLRIGAVCLSGLAAFVLVRIVVYVLNVVVP